MYRGYDFMSRTRRVEHGYTRRCRYQTSKTQMAEDGKAVGSAQLDWQTVETVSRYYVGKKAAEGRYQNAAELAKPRPTFDLLNNEEIAS